MPEPTRPVEQIRADALAVSDDSPDRARLWADLFGALHDASRLRILTLVGRGELAVGELAVLLEQSQPRISRHVRILEEAGLVERRREGSWVFVRPTQTRASDALRRLFADLPVHPDDAAVLAADRARLGAIQAERAAAAARYFANHAETWDAIRSLQVAEAEVEAAVLGMLRNRRLGQLVDLGTGTGRMAAILRGQASSVIAIDRSPEMLRVARSRLSGDGDAEVEFVLGDLRALPLADGSVDSIVMHQVLHFLDEPGAAITEAARVLRGRGHLLIVDFAPHDREELRRDAAHVRLGFSDGQIRGWFASAGLVMEKIEELGGGVLTVKLWLARRRSEDNL